ncbi:MAG: amidohydrolase [Promethearchaeota archaeon]
MSEKKIFHGGPILTMNDSIPMVECVGIEGEKIVAIGKLSDVKAKMGANAKIIDLKGNTMVPGFYDSHCHPIGNLFFQIVLNLRGVTSYEKFLSCLEEAGKTRKPGEWIFGVAYDELKFENPEDRKLSNRWDLDKACPNNPVFILRFDGHVGVANSLALQEAGIDESSEPPEGSEYRKNEKGELTGVVTEQAARMFLGKYAIPSMKQVKEAALKAFNDLAARGITSLHGILSLSRGGEFEDIGAIEIPIIKAVQDQILQNMYAMIYSKSPKKIKKIKKPPLHGGEKESQFKIGAVKLFIDGSLGASTAWMLEPYTDNPTSNGFCVYDDIEELYKEMKEAHELGYQLAIHAIGDKGNRVVVDLYKRLLQESPKKDHRHRIEHVSVITPDTIKDMKELGLIASIQPPFITTDAPLIKYRLSEKRAKFTYPFKSLVDAGILIVSGSDMPVEDPDPIFGLYALCTRGGFVPEQCISIHDALKSYTINAAFAAFEEDIKGSIEEGKFADLVILDKNPIEVARKNPEDLKDIKVVETIIRGKSVYKK